MGVTEWCAAWSTAMMLIASVQAGRSRYYARQAKRAAVQSFVWSRQQRRLPGSVFAEHSTEQKSIPQP